MGRAQGFDTDQVVRAACAVFWEVGYEQAAVPELEQATGVRRSSLYHAFGSKRGLFDAAVQSYLDEQVRPPLRRMAQGGADAVVNYLTGVRERIVGAEESASGPGCLLLNVAASPVAQDETVGEVLRDYLREVREALSAGIRARFPQESDESVEHLTELCSSLIVSALLIVRIDRRAALRSVDTAIRLMT